MTAQNAGPVRVLLTPIERARKLCEAMAYYASFTDGEYQRDVDLVVLAFAEIAADERERCARLAATKFTRPHYHTAAVAACHEIAAAIRRGDGE